MPKAGENRLRVADYAGRWGDAGTMNDLARTLRTCPEEDRFRFVRAALAVEGAPVGHVLDLANRCLRTPHYFELLLEDCVAHLEWGWMKTCLLHLLPRSGYRRAIAVLVRVLHTDAHTVRNVRQARYELPYVVWLARLRVQPTTFQQALDALDQALENQCRPS